MGSLNKAMIIGRLGADPEVRYTQSNTAVATLNVATNERFKDSSGEWRETTEWHRVVAWSWLAEFVQKYVKKGSQVYIEGPIQTRSWEDRDGQKRYTTEIKASVIQLLDSRNDDTTANRSNGQQAQPQQQSGSGPIDLSNDDFDDDLPF